MVSIISFVKPAAILTLVACVGCTDVSTTAYKSIAEARADGLFKRGWIPDVLPDDAGPLTETHNLDTNVRCARSRVARSAHPDVIARLHRLGFRNTEPTIQGLPAGFCPFDRSDLNAATHLFQRPNPQVSDQEFAALTAEEEFFFWSAY